MFVDMTYLGLFGAPGKGGGPIAFAGFGAAGNQGIAFGGGFSHNIVAL